MINFGANNLIQNTNPNLPNVSDVIVDWFINVTFEVVEKVMVGADYIEDWQTKEVINTRGVVQPPSPKDLKLLPEGAWAWEWLTVHVLPNVQFKVNQYIRYDNKVYKIMSKKDWSKYGYVKYTILEAFKADEVVNEQS